MASSNSLGRLSGIISKMKVSSKPKFYSLIKKHGNSNMFDYATNMRHNKAELQSRHLELWNQPIDSSSLPTNGFDYLIKLTEQGKLWRYPIDNEQGLESEKEVPFEDHVFLDHLLEDFPDNEYIRAYMQFVISGLARNHWMTVERKHDIVKFHKEYFEEKRDQYELKT